ncbi:MULTISPECIES: tetratricopeptide repeat protein [Vibrio]|uniref:tetratricopeptide repeat protein n=1 Tax=Vibrio TaxID=662 RepID=UPI0005AEDD80|nr:MULTISPECIES: tetratricopeptide repeat protein [Vibrio]KIP66575.1 hypothetical protein SN10_23775 [Vibrio harveyi]
MNKATFLSIPLLLLFGCSSTIESEESVVQNMERVDNHTGLINHYKGHLEKRPEDVQIMQELAKVYFDKGDIESAKFYADHLLNQGVKNSELLQLRGQIHSQDGEDSFALKRYKSSIEMGNNSGEIYVLSGISYCNTDQFSQAKNAFNQARLKGYNDVAVKNNLAVVYLAQRQYDDVISLLVPVYQENPSNQKVRANLAIALFKVGDVYQARDLLEGAFTDSQVAQISRKLHR